MSINQFIGMGNLGADAEVRQTTNGDKVANLRVALTERYTDRNGQKQEKTQWIRVTVFGPQADRVEQAKKGWKCFVTGRLQERTWTDRNGQEHTSVDIVVSNYPQTQVECFPPVGGGQQDQTRAPSPSARVAGQARRATAPASFPVDDSDDIPF